MPSVSPAQRRLMQAAAHGATFSKARQIRESMTPQQLREFTRGPSVAEALRTAEPPPKKGRR
jgi:hypothetical protein